MQRNSHRNGFIKANGTTGGENSLLLVEETYSGELVNEYTYNGKKEKPKKRSVRHQIHNARAFFSELFMPQGYPGTVSPDYLEYQKWDTLQAFASSQNGALATMAVLKGVGVGNENAIVLAAALTWLLKDGAGMIARILFSWSRGSRLDSDNKRWRLVADLLSDASFSLELLSSYLPQFFFAPICCFVAFLRAIVDVSGRTTRMAVMRHQARRDNLADVAAKDNSQETLVHVFSLLTSLILLPAVDGNILLIWLCSFLFTYVHLYSNYQAVKSLEFDILNQARFQIAVRHFIDFDSATSVQWCNTQEPILIKMSHGLRHLNLGCPIGSLPSGLDVPKILSAKFGESGQFDGLIWKWTGKAICVIDEWDGGTAWMALVEDATNEDIFDSLFAISHFGDGKGWPSTARIEAFRNEMADQGWSLQTNQLNIDDWRFSHKKDRKTG